MTRVSTYCVDRGQFSRQDQTSVGSAPEGEGCEDGAEKEGRISADDTKEVSSQTDGEREGGEEQLGNNVDTGPDEDEAVA